jgi:hypothetical protein
MGQMSGEKWGKVGENFANLRAITIPFSNHLS